MHKLIITGTLFLSLLVSALFSVPVFSLIEKPISITTRLNAFAQSNRSPEPDEKYSGIVLKKYNDFLIIRTNEDNIRSFAVSPNIKITRDRLTKSINDIKPDDHVNLTADYMGNILIIDAESNALVTAQKYLLPILAILLIISGLLLVGLRKKHQGTVKTKTYTTKH